MTNEEAKDMWCPFSRFVIDAPVGGFVGNRWDGGDGTATGSKAQKGCTCLGSMCMAWRYDKHKWDMDYATFENNLAGENETYKLEEPHLESYGYCGLAGKP